jgi:hypothetical protein
MLCGSYQPRSQLLGAEQSCMQLMVLLAQINKNDAQQ